MALSYFTMALSQSPFSKQAFPSSRKVVASSGRAWLPGIAVGISTVADKPAEVVTADCAVGSLIGVAVSRLLDACL
jgi:hypothetical protein